MLGQAKRGSQADVGLLNLFAFSVALRDRDAGRGQENSDSEGLGVHTRLHNLLLGVEVAVRKGVGEGASHSGDP